MSKRDLIVIGGSAGAVGPLQEILAGLPPDLPVIVLIVLHVPARGPAILHTLAEAAGALPVHLAEDGQRMEKGHVYIAPPDRHMIVYDGHLALGRGPRENLARPAIDPLFRSAALHHGPRTVGVVLSGYQSDGAAGLNAIRRCGGLAIVQDPAEASVPEMPLRALEATEVDAYLPAAKIAKLLSDLARQPAGTHVPVPPELQLEVSIAVGGPADTEVTGQFADPVALTCPDCGGVLSQVRMGKPLRFRCQVGHAFTAEIVASEQENRTDEALRVALRIIEERAELVGRMASENRQNGRLAAAETYADRAREYREQAGTIRAGLIVTTKGVKP